TLPRRQTVCSTRTPTSFGVKTIRVFYLFCLPPQPEGLRCDAGVGKPLARGGRMRAVVKPIGKVRDDIATREAIQPSRGDPRHAVVTARQLSEDRAGRVRIFTEV